jgi:hypothetical protein
MQAAFGAGFFRLLNDRLKVAEVMWNEESQMRILCSRTLTAHF